MTPTKLKRAAERLASKGKANEIRRRVGRPAREYTDEELAKIEQCGLAGCQTETIARLTGIPEKTLRSNFDGFLKEKRAERKLMLRLNQNKLAKDCNPTMLIFLGKNYLGQTDKHGVELDVSDTLGGILGRLAKKGK